MASVYEGKVAWVTGGGSGIGRALALELARQGAAVAVSGRRQERLAETVAEIVALGARGLAVPCDVTDDASVEAAVARVVAELGPLDVCVANAGFGVAGTIDKLGIEAWRRQFDVNVLGVVSTVRHALPALRQTKGRLALVSSVMAMLVAPGNGPYTASKFAVRAIGLTLSQELAGSGVSCTLLHPGFVESEIGQVDNRGVHHADREDKRPKRFMWPADKAARAMLKAVASRKREAVITGHGKVGGWFGRHLPGLVHFAMTRGK
jgi:NAD(P)-dependent dehydrogenase (short-subunit alcohol dehydrogenase family)